MRLLCVLLLLLCTQLSGCFFFFVRIPHPAPDPPVHTQGG
jgi:hypothetical protein